MGLDGLWTIVVCTTPNIPNVESNLYCEKIGERSRNL